jgi:hypothetical protein
VTLTAGGADLNFSNVLTTCTLDASACTGAVNDALSLLPDLKSDLTNLYTEIAAAAPEARIVVTGYPLLFGRPPIDFSLDVINAVNNGGVALNKTIEEAVAEVNEDGNIDYVDVTEEFREHGVLLRVNNTSAMHPADPKAFIHSPFTICDPTIDPDCHDPGDPAAYHPTERATTSMPMPSPPHCHADGFTNKKCWPEGSATRQSRCQLTGGTDSRQVPTARAQFEGATRSRVADRHPIT